MDDLLFNPTPDDPLMRQWLHAELAQVDFDISDVVLKALDKPVEAATPTGMMRHTMNQYYDSVQAQCPDLWPAVLTQLKLMQQQARKRRGTWTFAGSAIAASLVVALMSVTITGVKPKQSDVNAVATRQPTQTLAATAKPITNLASNALVPNETATQPLSNTTKSLVALPVRPPYTFKNTNDRVKRLKQALRYTVAHARSKNKAPLLASNGTAGLTHAQRVEREIVATATRAATRKRPATPASLEYVFHEATPTDDTITLGFAPQ
jgi:hypothetical protein